MALAERSCRRLTLVAALAACIPVMASADEKGDRVELPGGSFQMGSNSHYREEMPARPVTVGPFAIGQSEVTNRQFAAFVDATGYVTTAEKGLNARDYPNLPASLLVPGSMVFAQPDNPVELSNANAWWRYVSGASWRHPTGPESSIDGQENHPVVQVSPEDAAAYAEWVGGRLPTEAEWEYAALGGAASLTDDDALYDPIQGWKANSWQGPFPSRDFADDGHHGSAPVASYPANGYGLHDMLGNVWEHVSDWYLPGHPERPQVDPVGPPEALAVRFSNSATGPRRVVKGGSWLCAPNFCMRYRPTARQPAELGLGSNHIGFRVVWDVK
ncbi:MAG: formylglycine-generating enzyme family protein [Pseudomonadota bacterium]